MVGHSKWVNIKHKKATTDAKRGKIWTRLIKEIIVAVRLGDSDADSNPCLCLAMDKTTDANIPKGNINHAIQHGVSGLEGTNYGEIRYEGYGINGAAMIVGCLTDNRTRTVAEIRHGSDKCGGNIGTSSSVAFLFNHIGRFILTLGVSEDKLVDAVLGADADDVITYDDGSLEVICPPHDFAKVKTALEAVGLKAELVEVITKLQIEIVFTGEDTAKMQKLLDVLENLDDMQGVFINAAIGE